MVRCKITTGSIANKMPGWLNVVSCAAIAALMLLVTVNVILRAVFNSPIMGTYDFTGFIATILIGFGLAQCAVKDGHIEITLFTDKMGRRVRNAITAGGRVLSSVILAIYTYSLYQLATRYLKANELSVTSKTPICIFVYALSVCFLVFTITTIIRIFTPDPVPDMVNSGNLKQCCQPDEKHRDSHQDKTAIADASSKQSGGAAK